MPGRWRIPLMKWDKELVDAATARMVNRSREPRHPGHTNLHADILSDLAAALAGSLGTPPPAISTRERRYLSMFELIHGSAFDIKGKVGPANWWCTF